MHVLVVNCGSSSIKLRVTDGSGDTAASERGGVPLQLRLERVQDHAAELAQHLPSWLAQLQAQGIELGGVGHRVVHGGERFGVATRIDESVEAAIESLSPLAPLHNPINLAGIRAARALLPAITHVAVFDTAFHATLPRRARNYALDWTLAQRHGIRRYGFHGPSHSHVARTVASFMDEALDGLRIITCHLGNGASVAAIEGGASVETSMGMTPLEGLCMGTRSGDVDPGVLIHLMRAEGWDVHRLDAALNRESGLAGLSGIGNDLRDIEAKAAEGDERCRLALQVFCHRIRKYVGAYASVMGGVEAIAFAGGIGENSALVRHRVLQRLDFMGVRLDEDLNRDAELSAATPVVEISRPNSRVRVLVVATDEESEIARQTAELVSGADEAGGTRTIPIAVSARHIHLTPEMVGRLFGAGHELTPRADLSQPGQFACEEKLDIIGPKRTIEGVRVLGPTRSKNQVEISRTDEFFLGLDAPVRASGKVDNTPGVTLRGPAGTVTIEEGVICAWRHIHMTPQDADHFGVSQGDLVEVEIDSDKRDLVFGDVMIRVSPKYRLEMHIDTDEANAAELSSRAEGMLVGTGASARIRRRKV